MKDNECVTLTKEELRELIRQTVTEALTRLGMDTSHPLEVQRDFQFVRDWRTTTESVKGKAILAAVGITVIGILSLVWLGIKSITSR